MALVVTVGTNSYVTLVEAEAFIGTYYMAGEGLHDWWEDLDTTEKNLWLVRGLSFLERLNFIGYKTYYTETQVLAFPRNGDLTVPEIIKEAQILNAYYLSTLTTETSTRSNVKSYRIDDLSETFWDREDLSVRNTSDDVRRLLAPWLNGGYVVS